MTDDPFLTLLVEALNRMHPRFALAHGREYTAAEADEPPAARKARERSFVMEFYSEFRRLWDQAVPVQRGLGHIVIQGDPDAGSRTPDLLFWQLGERGQPDRRLGAVSFAFLSNPSAISADQTLLARFRDAPGYPRAVSVVVGRHANVPASGLAAADGVTVIFFDIDKWQVVPV
jgi:hypothetical protein